MLAGGLVWLNGPGFRWLAPKAAVHFLAKAGFRGSFVLEGDLAGGFCVKDLRLEGDKTLAMLTLGKATFDYRLNHLVKGRLDGFRVDGLHADLRLGPQDDMREGEKDPLNLQQLVDSLRAVRSRIIQMETDLKDISLNVTKDGKPVISLGRTRLHHKAGDADVGLQIGIITDASGREWPARDSSIVWNEDDLTIDRLDPLPGLSVRGLVVRFPAGGGLSAEAELHLGDAVFVVNSSPGLSAVQMNLREGRLVSETLAGYFDMKVTASGELSSLSMNVENLLPDPKAATGSLQVLLENLVYQDWRIPELSLDATLEEDRSSVALRGVVMDTEVSADAEAVLGRAGGGFQLGETRGRFNVAEISKLVSALADRIEAIHPEASVPASMVDGDFKVLLSNNHATSADVNLVLKPAEPEVASSVAVKARWLSENPVSAEVTLDGFMASADYDIESTDYQGRLELTDFRSARIDRWLDIVKAGTQGAIALSGTWDGGGSVKEMTHHGTLALTGVDLVRPDVPVIHVLGAIDYNWPQGFTTKDLRVKAAEQTVAAKLQLADGFLEMSDLLWRDGDKEMAAGSARLPMPEDFAKWRDMPAHDARPLAVSVGSKVLSLASLKDWVPAAAMLDPRSTGQVALEVSGTYAMPVIDAALEIRDLRSPEQPQLPPADLTLKVNAREGRIAVDGNAVIPDFAPAVMTASMPFRPAEWAENPELFLGEKFSARADLPRIGLSRFTALVPGAKKLSGTLTGYLEAAGEIRNPEAKGRIGLTNGGLVVTGPDIPPVTGLTASVDLSLEKISLNELSASVAGGTLGASGSLALENGKPGSIDFRLKGDHLPLKRDDALIVRVNTDLRLSGLWEQAALTGRVGVVDSIFFKDIELLPIGSPFTGPSVASLPKIDPPSKPGEAVPEPFRNWTLDVLARTVNPFLIRGNLAAGKVDAKLRIGGTIGDPLPVGEVSISDFKAALPFSTLTIRAGTARFTPETGLDPILEIRGGAEPRPYQVGVFAYGRASDPQLVLTSSPPLPENEIMTLLATGTTTSGLEDPQAASSRALQLFAEELRRGRFKVGKRIRPLLGLLDRVDFSVAEADPYSGDLYSTATLSLTDRWYLSAGMSGEGDSRVLAIWRLRFY